MTDRDLKAELGAVDEEIKRLESKRKDILQASLEATEGKACKDEIAHLLLAAADDRPIGLRYPIEVNRIHWATKDQGIWHEPILEEDPLGASAGRWVAVRPCAKRYEGRTFVGVMLGRFALGASARYDSATRILHLGYSFHNPAMYVPDIGRVIFGSQSWWGALQNPEDLRQITDADIENVWYVRALRDLEKEA